ncbi:hypothetical protein EIP91_000017 [Steccherinum ochraceum]|uniref:Kinesin motor domain-containing protein n=1 Tax=Steccherinum ochraceum TaxID=92696 RepID=A0A4R0RXU0_9APHY|nr:hypothetical protein EIP91_000017 [Steccherinum ochraceum]
MSSTNIKVVCRFRPPNSIEQREGGEIIVDFDENTRTVHLRSSQTVSGPEKDGFTFDRVFPPGTKQAEVFDYGVKDIVKDVLDGYNGTVFAYGQTGSGKTFTMMGADIDSPDLKGLIPRITEQIFQSIVESDAHLEYLVKVSYMEIYLERIRDLLAPQNDNLQVHEEKSKGVYVKNLSDYYVSSAREVYEIMRQGGAARVVSSTNMNAESSRSHSIFLITINQKNTDTGAQKTGNLYLVDLAGSEKVGKTGASGQTLEEAKKINKSLSALGMVINALTDTKAKHIPYRDSKLTRILQESLGGNSRTTLIINCSPSSYNDAETLGTLRFGIRAKSIKNTARVNAELSPLELKGLLAKAQQANTNYQKVIAALEAELAIWRSGGSVDQAEWASSDKPGSAAAAAAKKAPTSPTPSSTRSMTPVNPVLEGLRGDVDSRPQTPTVVGLDKDEREEFLRRENELSDQLGERESAVKAAEKLVVELKEELAFLKEQEGSLSKENKAMSGQLNDLRLQVERLDYDNKESMITIDILKEQNQDGKSELEELKKTILDLKAAQKDASAEDKEKKKQEKMALMMAKFDAQGTFSEKDEQLRQLLAKLDSIDGDNTVSSISHEDIVSIRRQLADGQVLIRETVDRLRQSQEENEILTRRRDELESRNSALETEYEELLEKTIHDEDISGVDNKLESQYLAKREAHSSEVTDLKQQLELRSNEIRTLNGTIDSLKSVNEELKRAFAVTSAGIEGGKNLAESAQDLERTRKAISVQLAEFDGVKKSLMRDLQNRCEKVVELEIQLDEIKEQYNNVIRNSNSKAQQKKMAFLERNLEQLTLVQKQLVDQNSALKKEAGIAERKLLARNERIQNLEALLQDADRRLAVQNQKFEAQLQAVKERLDQARAQKAAISAPLGFGRIAKPLRGGGGASSSAPTTSPNPSLGGGSANPLARLQNEEAGNSAIVCLVPMSIANHDSSVRKSSGSSSSHSISNTPSSGSPSPAHSQHRKTSQSAYFGAGMGTAAGLKPLNSGWQVWANPTPAPRNPSGSSANSIPEASPSQAGYGLNEPWAATRTSSGNWDEMNGSPQRKDIPQMDAMPLHRQRQASGPTASLHSTPTSMSKAGQFSPQRFDGSNMKDATTAQRYNGTSPTRGGAYGPGSSPFAGQQPLMQPNTTSGNFDASSTVDGDLSVALRGMAVEDEYGSVGGFRHPSAGPQSSQGFNMQTPVLPGRGAPNAQQPHRAASFNGFPQPDFSGYYPGHSRVDFPFYDAYRAAADATMYAASPALSAATAASTYTNMGPTGLHPHMLADVHGQQSNVFYDYSGSGRQGSAYFYPTQPVMYHSHPGAVPNMPTPTDKKPNQQNMNMIFGNMRSTPSPHPQAFQAMDYAAQMQMMLPGALYGHAAGMNANANINMFHRGRRAVYDANAANRSPLLDEFRSNKTRGWDLRDIFGHVLEFSRDQHGSRFIQQKLEGASADERQTVFEEIVPQHSLDLVQDVFGNYVIQKLFEHGTATQRSQLAATMEGHILQLSQHMYGCRVVQKAVEFISPEHQGIFVKELDANVLQCVRDANGNHVIQRLIELVPPERLGFIAAFRGSVFDLASHAYGCRVLQRQRCLEHLPDEQTRPLLDERTTHPSTSADGRSVWRKSAHHPFAVRGNYVIQFILEKGQPQDKAAITSKLRAEMLKMSCHKFASNVCEKALVTSEQAVRHALVNEILLPRKDGIDVVVLMMKDQYGNYVLQRALSVAEGEQKENLIKRIRPHLLNARRQGGTYGKHLIAIERLLEKCATLEVVEQHINENTGTATADTTSKAQ